MLLGWGAALSGIFRVRAIECCTFKGFCKKRGRCKRRGCCSFRPMGFWWILMDFGLRDAFCDRSRLTPVIFLCSKNLKTSRDFLAYSAQIGDEFSRCSSQNVLKKFSQRIFSKYTKRFPLLIFCEQHIAGFVGLLMKRWYIMIYPREVVRKIHFFNIYYC